MIYDLVWEEEQTDVQSILSSWAASDSESHDSRGKGIVGSTISVLFPLMHLLFIIDFRKSSQLNLSYTEGK
jgi:hypothetical protein